jgi:tripartite ATP-independent transporter DctP family solute receptor
MHRVVSWKSLVILATALGAGVAAPVAPATAQAPVVLKLGTTVAPGNPSTDSATEFAKVAGERSNGRLKVEVYPSNQLGRGENALMEGLLLGSVDITASGAASVGGIFEPAFQALDLPFLWASRQQIFKVMDGPIGQELFKKLEAKGFKGLCFAGGWGFRNMMSNKRAVSVVDDMKGQTIRVQESPTYIGMMKALGANPVPMPFGELYLAMKQGTIDGMELPPSSVVSEKFHEVTKYYSLTQHSYSPIGFYMSMRKYQALPAELQKVVDEAAKAACAFQRKDEVEKDIAGLDQVRKAGVQVNEVKNLQEFQDRMGPVYEQVGAKAGKDFMDRLMPAIRAAK